MSLVSYLHLPAGQKPPDLETTEPFRAVIVVEQAVDDEWRDAVSDWLVESCCLYMVAWGQDCAAWDDSVGWSSIAASGPDTSDGRFVMTTWHADETLAEAFWFAANCAFHPTMALDQTLIIHVARDSRPALLEEYAQARERDE